MSIVRAKKSLGQHFLKDQNIARKITSPTTVFLYEQSTSIANRSNIYITNYRNNGNGFYSEIF